MITDLFDSAEVSQFSTSLIRNDFYSFIKKSFKTTNPGTKFKPNWHLEKIAETLNKCERGEIKRLIINIPPRYMKSLCVTVSWPAWLLGRDPSRRVIAASYSNQLALKHALDTRLIVNSSWYKKIFPDVVISADQNEKAKFITTKRGYRLATSVEGTLTGEGGNFLILDDPHNPVNIFSRKERENTINWYNQVFATRLDDKENGVIIIVMQRLHTDDLCGYLQNNSLKNSPYNWHELILPAIENDRALHESRESLSYLKTLKAELGSYVFSAQYLQQPLPQEGGMIRPEWFMRYSIAPEGRTIQSWDTAIKSGDRSDYSVCTTWVEFEHNHYLIEVLRVKAEYPQLKKLIISQAEKYQPELILIEDKASGQSLLQELRQTSPLPFIAVMPKFDKVTRMAKASTLIEAGKVFIPAKAYWLSEFEMELYTFPNSSHDDICDSLSQYLNWVIEKNHRSSERIRML